MSQGLETGTGQDLRRPKMQIAGRNGVCQKRKQTVVGRTRGYWGGCSLRYLRKKLRLMDNQGAQNLGNE